MTRFTSRQIRQIGVALVALGLLVNPWSIGYLATDDATIDALEVLGLIVLFDAVCILGGLQLLVRWIDPLAWGRPVGFVRGTSVVTLAAALTAGTWWGVAAYGRGHSHTTLVGAGDEDVTPEQQRWADDFYRRSLDAALKHGWFDFDNAMRQGFEVDRINHTHFPNQKYMFDDVILDPERPEWLVYDNTPRGKVLMALMFFTRSLEEVGPTPAGRLAQWHFHPFDQPRCAIKGLWTVGDPDANGVCAEGIPVRRSPEMFHVWFMDHPLGHFTEMKIVPEVGREGFDYKQLHPIVVHFAIALFVIAVLLDVAAIVLKRPEYHRAAWLNLVLGAVAAAGAVATGLTAEVFLKATHEMHRTLDTHKALAFASLGSVLMLTGWRFVLRGRFPTRAAAALYLTLSAAGVAGIVATGYYGGEMVYGHGAGVRAIDEFTRESYWKRVREVYRREPAGTFEKAIHH
jgi:uncharacterized membrane protein